jgi:RNA polymerase sigma-70 factor (ECF subfamily)
MKHPLASAFLAALPAQGGAVTLDAGELETELTAVVAAARARYPGIKTEDARYVRHLAGRADPALSASEALALLRTADLLLACGCADGDRAAIALLESECIRGAQSALGKRAISSEVADEANQNVRERLLVGERPKVLEYDGKGDLKSWVRVVVVREAIYLSKRGKKEVPLSFDLLAVPASQDNPEIAYFKAHYRAEYKEAFEAAVEELTSRERALLRQQVVLGMSVDEIGVVYQVHRATAARWVQAARDQLLAKARLQLAIRLNLPRAEIENIVRMIESQLALSMGRLLKATQV